MTRFMQKSLFILYAVIAILGGITYTVAASVQTTHEVRAAQSQALPVVPIASEMITPALPETSADTVPAETSAPPVPVIDPAAPALLSIPSIALRAPVEHLGINEKGEMDVPLGTTENVGWYRYGTAPGAYGTAVFDAHVFAAFRNLDRVERGDEILVTDSAGVVRRFLVTEIHNLPLETISPEWLFNRADAKRINLITCSGTYVKSIDTYDHRLIVSAVLVE